MKRLVALAILCTMAMGSFAQNVNDVWLLLQNGNIPGAKKKIEECMPSNQNNAMAWLYRGNVYMQIYDRDQSRLEKNPSYISKDPEAAFIAYESFFKALELDPKIKEKTPGGLVEPTFGQITMGGPIYNMGVAAYKAKDVEKAEKYFRAAVKCFNLDPAYKEYAGSCYYQLAIIKQNDKEAYKEVLDEAVNAKTNLSLLYQLAYDYYDKANDMEQCGKILSTAKKNVKKTDITDIYALELGYASKIKDTARFEKAIKKAADFDSIPEFVATCATYLVNAKEFNKADTLLSNALVKNPENYELNNMMGYTYFMYADDCRKMADAAVKEHNYDLSGKYKTQERELMATAHDWCEKAYNIKKDEKQNAMMLYQLKLQLGKDVPAELKEFVEGTPSQN